MAHWVIYSKGFEGSFYTCSSCGETYWDIARYVGAEDFCPNCGEQMNVSEDEYIN